MTPSSIYAGQRLEDALRLRLSVHGRFFRLGQHFVLGELASRCGADLVLVHPALVCALAQLRRHFGRPVVVTSGYRTPAHNACVGGKSRSRHLYGMAADVQVPGVPPADVAAYCDGVLGVGGLGRYRTFTHLDVDGRGRRW